MRKGGKEGGRPTTENQVGKQEHRRGVFGNRGGNYCQAPVVYFHSRCALEEKKEEDEEEEEKQRFFTAPCLL